MYSISSIGLEESSGLTLSPIFTIAGVVATTYGLNILRTPLEQKLGITESELDKEKEFGYTIKRLNELQDCETLSFHEVNDKVNDSLDDLVLEIEGYVVQHAKKIKKSLVSRPLFRRGVMGLMNPFIQEAIVTNELFPQSIAHEKAHLAGYAKEAEAQLLGFMTLFNSKDDYLRYLAYEQRLSLLLRYYYPRVKEVGESFQYVEDKGLNLRSVNRLKMREEELDKAHNENFRYTKIKIKLGEKLRSKVLFTTGEKDIRNAYVEKPLRLISSYDPPD